MSHIMFFIYRKYSRIHSSILDDLVRQMSAAASEKFHFVFSHELEDRIQIKM